MRNIELKKTQKDFIPFNELPLTDEEVAYRINAIYPQGVADSLWALYCIQRELGMAIIYAFKYVLEKYLEIIREEKADVCQDVPVDPRTNPY